jgi:RES domain-containing protein
MLVYRIALTRFATLSASGIEGRWNSSGIKVLYTASSRALACLENVVHRSGEGLNERFSTMIIDVPSTERIEKVTIKDLPENWQQFSMEHICRQIGDDWFYRQESLLLQVPSIIIPEEHNYLINTQHRNFRKIKLKQTAPFLFDPRIKQ